MRIYLLFLATSLFGSYLPASFESDLYASIDLLYWQGQEKGLEFASKNAGSTFNQKVQISEPTFAFHPAFRIGMGYHLPHDNWDVELDYTFYSTQTMSYASDGIRPVWTCGDSFLGAVFRGLWNNAACKWHLHTHLFDLSLKERLWLTSTITIEPALGLKFALLAQGYKVDYQNGNTASNLAGTALIQFISSTISMKNRSLNIGPSASIGSHWHLCHNLALLGNLSGSLLASRFSVGRNETDLFFANTLQQDIIRESNTYWLIRPQASAALGLGWSDCHGATQYGFSALYEAQVFWKQNMLYRYIDQTNAAMISPTQGDLYMHGLTLNAFIHF